MSIIYDALQKTQRNREYLRLQNALAQKKPQHRRHLKPMVVGSLVLIIGAGLGAIFSFYGLPSRSLVVAKQSVTRQVVQPPVSKMESLPALAAEKTEQEVAAAAPVSEALTAAQVLTEVQSLPSPQPEAASSPLSSEASVVISSSKLVLNGVLIAGTEKMALINNQAYHLGESVEGMKLIGIEANKVTLQNGEQLVELKVPI